MAGHADEPVVGLVAGIDKKSFSAPSRSAATCNDLLFLTPGRVLVVTGLIYEICAYFAHTPR